MRQFLLFLTFIRLATSQDGDAMEEIFEALTFRTDCRVIINSDLGARQPLYIRPGTEQFYHPTREAGVLEVGLNQEIELFCPDSFESPSGVFGDVIRVTCSSGNQFFYRGILYNFREFSCRNWPTSIARRRTNQRCFNDSTIVDVGFQVDQRFLRVFSTCHNPITEENHYTEHTLTPMSVGFESGVVRPRWMQGDFYPGKNVDTMMTRTNQRNAIAATLGSSELAAVIIEEPNSNVFLARGHLAAMTDFISANEQRSSFFLLNIAPQFQTFNGGNWVSVEISVRRLAADRNINLDVYTGTYGRTRFHDVAGIKREIFIDHSNSQIPVPFVYYKIIVNPANRSGVVILGINNPHLTLQEILADYVICNDISDRINYLSWSRTRLDRGYGYACEVNDFLRRVPHIPGLVVNSLLV